MMFNKVIVGVADQQAGRDAIALARRLAAPDTKLTLAFVQPRVLGATPGSDTVAENAERRRALERLVELADEAQVDAQPVAVQARSVAAGLHELARRGGDLLVVGGTNSDDYERVFIRDDTREVLKDPPCPVAVAPGGCAPDVAAPERIGVAYDGSPGSERALEVARTLAHEHRCHLVAFEAVREPVRIHDAWHVDREIQATVAAARERIATLSGVEVQVSAGEAVEELVRFGASVDLLVVGAHEHKPFEGLRDGSTAQRVAADAPCPLLVLA
jgi:nucleotide-binding universal stress UspA family protein